ncbi:MAG: hypothetical protein KGH64_05285 [Candidatus Micrarchaeota archaeon]|nr:hypothetical protein [Candidatus Micrarchaeota archaeon]
MELYHAYSPENKGNVRVCLSCYAGIRLYQGGSVKTRGFGTISTQFNYKENAIEKMRRKRGFG